MSVVTFKNVSTVDIYLNGLGQQLVEANNGLAVVEYDEILNLDELDKADLEALINLGSLVVQNSLGVDLTPADGIALICGLSDTALINANANQGQGNGSSIEVIELSSTSKATLTKSWYVTVPGMIITPDAGSYLASFSTSYYATKDKKEVHISLFKNTARIEHSERHLRDKHKEMDSTVHTQAVINVDGTDSISVKGKRESGSLIILDRSLILLKYS